MFFSSLFCFSFLPLLSALFLIFVSLPFSSFCLSFSYSSFFSFFNRFLVFLCFFLSLCLPPLSFSSSPCHGYYFALFYFSFSSSSSSSSSSFSFFISSLFIILLIFHVILFIFSCFLFSYPSSLFMDSSKPVQSRMKHSFSQ